MAQCHPAGREADMLFGKRGKNDLLALNVDYSVAQQFIAARMNKQVGS